MWKKGNRYYVSEMPFDKNLAETIKVWELKKDDLYWYVSFVLHTSITKKGWIDATFFQGLNHKKWVVILSFIQNGLTQNKKMDHKKTFHRSLQTMQQLPMYRCKYTSEADIESRGLYNFFKLFWFLRMLK